MYNKREKESQRIVPFLINNFEKCIAAFDENPPFSKYGQFEYHYETIMRRIELNSAKAALEDDKFLRCLYKTLRAWGIGSRGSKLLPFPDFVINLQNRASDIIILNNIKIDDNMLDIEYVTAQLWSLIDSLEIVNNIAKLVSCSKALHHILPDLVVPIDREYTRVFFGWSGPVFQYKQQECFRTAFKNFAKIARATNLNQYVGKKWHTSRTKVLDNAIVGLRFLNNYLYA